QFGWQGDPELETTRAPGVLYAAAVPHASARLHPLCAAGAQDTLDIVRVDVADCSLGDIGEGGNTGMRMQTALHRRSTVIHEIQEHEGLEDFPQIRRAHQARDGTVSAAPSAIRDGPRAHGSEVSGKCGAHEARAFLVAAVHHSRSS